MSSEDKFMSIGFVIVIAVILIFVGINCMWVDHSNIIINVKEKYTNGDRLYVVSNYDKTYCVVKNINYAKVEKGKSYEVSVAHNPYIGANYINTDGTWNIDEVIREVV